MRCVHFEQEKVKGVRYVEVIYRSLIFRILRCVMKV